VFGKLNTVRLSRVLPRRRKKNLKLLARCSQVCRKTLEELEKQIPVAEDSQTEQVVDKGRCLNHGRRAGLDGFLRLS
jgi:hypothetical protein